MTPGSQETPPDSPTEAVTTVEHSHDFVVIDTPGLGDEQPPKTLMPPQVSQLKARRRRLVGAIIGLAAALDLEPLPDQPGLRARSVFERGLDQGVLLRFSGDMIALAPPFISTPAEIDMMADKLRAAIRAAR